MKKGMQRRRTGKQYMNDAGFAQLQESLNDALQHARGERADLRVTRVPLPAPPRPISASRVVRIRHHMHFSQSMFAKLLNVSPRTVQDWEQGRRTPSDAALKLLVIAEKHPEILLES